jgi:LPXTG-motif cell wall-anchored protein
MQRTPGHGTRTRAITRLAVCGAAVALTGAVLTSAPAAAFADTPAVTTLFAADSTPGVAASDDGAAVELGVRFTPAVSGTITGLRFYKGPGNTGTHTGSLWRSSGSRVATLTFPDSAATGWQTALFSTPVPVTAATTYVASYFAPHGHYAVDPHFFATPVTNGPLTAPAGHNGVFRYGATGGFPAGSFNATNYWVDPLFVAGGDGVTPSTFSFFVDADLPAVANWEDAGPVEVGLKFHSDVAGTLTGLRFYKGTRNTGTHTGSLWASDGHLLTTATFSAETASGWQTVTFAEPVPVTAHVTYVASYHAPDGFYSVNENAFADVGLDSGPLHTSALGSAYRPGAGFPDTSSVHNYWVDVIFKAAVSPPPATTPPTTTPPTTTPPTTTPPTTTPPTTAAPAGGAGGGNSLPITGSNAVLFAGSGLLLAGTGFALLLRYRRRDRVTFVP